MSGYHPAMASKRGKLAALAASSIAAAAIAACGIVFRGHLLEQWYLHRLDSEDPAVQERAAARLAEMESARAVPRLIEIYIGARDEPHFSGSALLSIGPQALRGILEKLKQEGESRGNVLGWLIQWFDDRAVPVLEENLSDKDPAIRYIAVEALRDMRRYGREIGSCVHALAGMARNEKEESLNRIAAAIAILGIWNSAAIPPAFNLFPAGSPTKSFIAALEGGSASPEDVQTVRDALDGGSKEVRSQALQVLSNLEIVILVEKEISNRSKGNPRSERP